MALQRISKSLNGILKAKQLVHAQNKTRPLTFCYLTNQQSSLYYSTSIYVSEKHPKKYFEFDHRLDDKNYIDDLKTICQKRNCKINVDLLISNYKKVVSLKVQRGDLEQMRKENARKMAALVKLKSKTAESKQLHKTLIDKGKDLKEKFRTIQDSLWELEQLVMEQALSLPNKPLPDVTEQEKVLHTHLEGQELLTEASHMDLIESTKEVVFSNIGSRAYYLRGKLALLEQSLIQQFSSALRDRGLICMLAPEVVLTPIVESGCIDVTSPQAISRLDIKHEDKAIDLDWQLDNKYLYGASHLSFLAYFARMLVDKRSPDSTLFVVGRNYRPSSDEDLPGLYGVLQSTKICMCAVNATEEDSLVSMETFQNILMELYKGFNLPFRMVSMPLQSLTAMEMKRIELQIWAPSLNKYLKIGSVSACGDYSSRRLMMRYSDNKSLENTQPVFMVHSEVTDITKLIAVLLEHDRS